jgi:hypothetical protein
MSDPLLAEWFPEEFAWVKAYRALASVLQGDPLLSRMPITWDTRVGSPNETQPPGSSQMPWIALVPLELPLVPATEIEDQGRFAIRIDMAVRGTHWDDLGNFAGAVRSALNANRPAPDGTTVDQYFRNAGVINYWLRRAGIGVKRTEATPNDTAVSSPPPVVDQFASAVVEFLVFLPTHSPDFPLLPPIG